MHELLFDVSTTDPATLAALAIPLAMAACFVPGRRAASIEPKRALRME
jgi:ABC-type lipoprotein release transport system permease subunit